MTARAGAAMRGTRSAIVTAAGPAAAPGDPVEALRRRLSGQTAREHVVLDFLADDLREAREALAGVQGYVGRIEASLAAADVSQQKLLALALGGGPIDQLDYLAEVLSSVRRRVAQVAARM
jgi:CRP-like cAMP-binding protein